MIVSHDIYLVLLSILVATIASYSGMLAFAWNDDKPKLPYKARLSFGSLIIGGGIWTMHFIGMLSLNLPAEINYAVLPTLISFFVAIILTGLGLYAATSVLRRIYGLSLGAVFMGLGIAAMHYIGMDALSTVCKVGYNPYGVLIAIGLGIGASFLSLWMVTRTAKTHGTMLYAAAVLGLAISSMHYSAMHFTTLELRGDPIQLPNSVISDTYLTSIVAATTFLIAALFLLLFLPDRTRAAAAKNEPSSLSHDAAPSDDFSDQSFIKLSHNGEVRYVAITNILYIAADGHYTRIGYINRSGGFSEKFCDRRLSDLRDRLKKHQIVSCHRSYLVNLGRIRAIQRKQERGFILLDVADTPEIPVSRSHLSALSQAADDARRAV